MDSEENMSSSLKRNYMDYPMHHITGSTI